MARWEILNFAAREKKSFTDNFEHDSYATEFSRSTEKYLR